MAAVSTTHEEQQKVWELIKEVGIALMVTSTGEGLRGRPMAAMNKTFEGDLWFASRDDTPKLGEIASESHVLLAYSEPKSQNYVSVAGMARVIHDKAKVNELWTEGLRVWFPAGPDDPNIALIRVTVETAEYWDSPSSKWLYAYGYAKARLTGEAPRDVGENKVVRF